jgi:hypothetical protein
LGNVSRREAPWRLPIESWIEGGTSEEDRQPGQPHGAGYGYPARLLGMGGSAKQGGLRGPSLGGRAERPLPACSGSRSSKATACFLASCPNVSAKPAATPSITACGGRLPKTNSKPANRGTRSRRKMSSSRTATAAASSGAASAAAKHAETSRNSTRPERRTPELQRKKPAPALIPGRPAANPSPEGGGIGVHF